MKYRISQIKITPGEGMEELVRATEKKVAKALHRPADKVKIDSLDIVRESIDARKKPDVKLVYTVDFEFDGELPFEEAVSREYEFDFGSVDTSAPRPVIAGFGPCGIFAALILSEAGLKPIVLERGKAVEERVKDVNKFREDILADRLAAVPDPESNVQFGEGGAGTFSDGKLTTGIKDVRIRKVLREFVDAGADPAILYKHKPHIGTDRLQEIVKNLRLRIEELGGEVRFGKRLEDIRTDQDRKLTGLVIHDNSMGNTEEIATDMLILATGHSARDTFRMLYDKGLEMEQKPFSIGVRIEHLQETIDAAQYGDPKLAEIIGPAEYKLNYRCEDGRGVYTFCMCPGGEVINASTEKQTQVTNGMSNSARDGRFANSGLLVDVRTSDVADVGCDGDSAHPLAGIEFQRRYERLAWENNAVSTYGGFKSSAGDPVRKSIPDFASAAILEAMPHLGRKLKGFDSDDARMTAVESRSSSPVRIIRDDKMQANVSGIIPAGEGPGYAGGIMSAAVDGIRAAEAVICERSK